MRNVCELLTVKYLAKFTSGINFFVLKIISDFCEDLMRSTEIIISPLVNWSFELNSVWRHLKTVMGKIKTLFRMNDCFNTFKSVLINSIISLGTDLVLTRSVYTPASFIFTDRKEKAAYYLYNSIFSPRIALYTLYSLYF